eukprot:TRINITY_DN113998_c0_g1_i1.p1 TRINITY_DN113998_c0_g1~~TRINITY_DN113998_c0_g1_i1.p1  ORF type:complete len:324 (+),score=69.98 TRINITY_DN113998_c0_g1_i1:112-1083(+)
MPAGPGLTAQDHILWAQRIQKEGINAKSRPGGFSVRAAVSIPDVPTKFKPGHMDPREASGSGFDPKVLGWDPKSSMTTDFRRCMNSQNAGPRERHQFPETCQQEIGWIQGHRGKVTERSEPAGSKPTHMGLGWMSKDGHGMIARAAAHKAGKDGEADIPNEPAKKTKKRRSKDGNVREELGVPPYATTVPCAEWDDEPDPPAAPVANSKKKEGARSGRSKSRRRRDSSKTSASELDLRQTGEARGMQKAASLPTLPPNPRDPELFKRREKALGYAMVESRRYLNGQHNMWYKPLSNSDVATFADAYTKAWGVGLYAKSGRKGT